MCALTKENIKLPLQCIAMIYEKWRFCCNRVLITTLLQYRFR
jgi:hypothetical protein